MSTPIAASLMRTGDTSGLRFIVLQPGARRHYAVPALLARAGMLTRFYTDFSPDIGLIPHFQGRWLRERAPRFLARPFGRQLPPEIPRHLVRHIPADTVVARAAQLLSIRGVSDYFDVSYRLSNAVKRDGFSGATALYTLLINSDLDLVRHARDSGLRVVHDVMIGPDVGLWLHEERKRWPGIEQDLDLDLIRRGSERDSNKYELADLIVVPSPFTAKAVLALGADPTRVAIVPFGLDEARLAYSQNFPVRGRALFVGSVGLRKGSHYLAEATRILQRRGVPSHTRVVGPFHVDMIGRSEFRGPSYIGQVPRAQIAREFKQADVFVFPTLYDSFGMVQLEAMACGVPVITTPNCGAVVRDGVDGFIVPVRDAQALADRIEQLVTDRELRARMSESARERAKEFTWDRYGERLITALRTLET